MRRRSIVVALCVVGCGDDSVTPDAGADAFTPDVTVTDAAPDVKPQDASDAAVDASDASSLCSPTAAWGTPQLLPISTSASDYFGSVTPDELSIAWMTADGTILYADRSNASMPFGTPSTLSTGAALDRVSLTADGLTLIVVQTNRWSLAQTTRATRGATFSATLDPTPFAQIDPAITEIDGGNGPPHGLFADPLLSPDGQFLYFSQIGVLTHTMNEAYQPMGSSMPWLEGRTLLEAQLVAPDTSGTRRRPTGISNDDLTLFYYDMTTSNELFAFRADPLVMNTYTTFVDAGAAYENAMPTATCHRIYFSSAGSGGLDLFYADKL